MDLVHTENMQLSKTTHYVGIRERGGAIPNTVTIAFPILPQGANYPYFCGEQLTPDECPTLLAGDEFEIFSSGVETYLAMVINAEMFNRECLLLTGQPFSSLRYSQRIRINKQNQQWLAQLILQTMERLKNQSLQLPKQQQELLEKQLIEQLLLAIHPPPGKKMRTPNRLQVAYKAEQLIRQTPQKHLTVEQLCKRIGCSSRTLHLGFKERYGTTPVQYGRTLALNAVWKQLYYRPSAETITEVAMAWGFFHLGRFSQQYKQLFNELPSVTVERNKELPV